MRTLTGIDAFQAFKKLPPHQQKIIRKQAELLMKTGMTYRDCVYILAAVGLLMLRVDKGEM